jgi:hypothetical protein
MRIVFERLKLDLIPIQHNFGLIHNLRLKITWLHQLVVFVPIFLLLLLWFKEWRANHCTISQIFLLLKAGPDERQLLLFSILIVVEEICLRKQLRSLRLRAHQSLLVLHHVKLLRL